MTRDIAMTTDIWRQSGDGEGFRAYAVTTAREREIDQRVCALYGLAPEEIKIVEFASVQTSARQGSAVK